MRTARSAAWGLLALGTLACAPRPAPRLDAPAAAARYAYLRRAPLRSDLPVAVAYQRAADARRRLVRFSSRIDRRLPSAIEPAAIWTRGAGLVAVGPRVSPTSLLDTWTPLGPGNIGGRTRVVRYHPTNHSTLFAAGVSGGIWRSDDAGGSWRPIADGLANLTVNALALDARIPDVLYAGTGEGYMREEVRGTGLPLRGSGIFMSRDAGASWQRLPQTTTDDFLWVNDLEIGVGDPRRLYAATRTGVWRSLDAGDTWTQLLATTVRGGCLDLVLRPDGPDDTLFASCGSYEQATVYRFAAASRSASAEAVLREPSMGRTSLAIAPSNPDVMYALAASNDAGADGLFEQGLLAVYRSDRGGIAGSWEVRVRNTDPVKLNTLLLTNAASATVQECGSTSERNSYVTMGWYVNVIAVDPRDPDRVWAAGVDWFRSDDGGRNWGLASFMTGNSGAVTGAHVDQHAIAFHPDYDGSANQIAIVGNDGGLARTATARGRVSTGTRATCASGIGAMGVRWESLNHDYGVTQFYHGLPFPDGTSYLGGTQDNSTLVGADALGPSGWQAVIGGDGGYVAINPLNPSIVYGEWQWAHVNRSTDGGMRFSEVTTGLDPVRAGNVSADANYLFVTPFVMDPAAPTRLWLGGEFMYRTTNSGTQWVKASRAMPAGGLVSAIAVDAADPNHVVAGTSHGDLVWSHAALAATSTTAWASARPREGWVTSVALAGHGVIYVTYGNFGASHVYRSTDDGLTWTVVDGAAPLALPDIPVHSIVVDPDDSSRLYLGTDLGVFVSVDGGAGWMVEETGFGPAVTEWLALQRDTAGRTRLFAFTHGRGAWRVDLP